MLMMDPIFGREKGGRYQLSMYRGTCLYSSNSHKDITLRGKVWGKSESDTPMFPELTEPKSRNPFRRHRSP